MKRFKKILLIILIAAVLVSAVIGYFAVRRRGVFVGMSLEEFKERIPQDDYFEYIPYVFFRNSMGGHVVARLSDSYEIVQYDCFDPWQIDTSDAAFARIKIGMSVEEVVSIVGIPSGSPTFGLSTLEFTSDSGTRYVICLTGEPTAFENGLTVAEITAE